MAVKYCIQYEPAEMQYQMERYLQDLEDSPSMFPDVYELCAERLNMRLDDLIAVAKSDDTIGRYLNTLISRMEYRIQKELRNRTIDPVVGKMMLVQPVFSWRDKAVEVIEVKQTTTYDDETKRRILESNDPAEILKLRDAVDGGVNG